MKGTILEKLLAGTALLRAPDPGSGPGQAPGGGGGDTVPGGGGGGDTVSGGGGGGDTVPGGAGDDTVPGAGDADPYAAWGDGLSEEEKAVIERKHWKSPVDAVKSYRSYEELVGKDVLPPPDPEKLQDWPGWERLGAAAKPEDVKIERPELKEGAQWDENLEGALRTAAPALKLAPFQVKGLVEMFAGHVNGQVERTTAEIEAATAATREAFFRKHGSKAEGMLADAQRAVDHFEAGDEVLALLDQKMGSGAVMDFFARLGAELAEDGAPVAGRTKGFAGRVTPEQAKAQLRQKRADPDWAKALDDRAHPGHANAAEEFKRLNRIANGLDPDA